MSFAECIVVDTGIWVSAALRPASLPAQAVALAFARYEVCASSATLDELQRVLARDKFDRYLPKAAREAFFDGVQQRVLRVEVHSEVTDCTDPKDNPFLALALDARASLLLASDPHLCSLHPWRGIPILNPAAFVAALAAKR
ncbi:PIN domain DNA-binding protein [Hydrogenophaga taeniospiralis CCUG 15921]|uniref:PIN domain DNA-binding protein n=1 Tax=Hydrogenophaga taeniospiralis CCUG 15921 TaxID=1281780 RepID=A0A9X4SCC3_9BURK|nr:putative toxin-antitoxin system toxin component, PIN family [Hydrogenophaga taeniospiralis]MDG5978334.1 PIN domain DNA-binding protein [Hydrogenophaga taeniospiralis CCUG 15921]